MFGLRTSSGVKADRWRQILHSHRTCEAAMTTTTAATTTTTINAATMTNRATTMLQQTFTSTNRKLGSEEDLALENIFDASRGGGVEKEKECSSTLPLSALYEEGFLKLAEGALFVPQKSLAVLDSILPHLLRRLNSYF